MRGAERVLVTGATGMIGRAVVEQFLACGYTVRAMVRDVARLPSPDRPRLEVVVADMAQPQSLVAALDAVDGVVHLAACKNDERQSEAVNVEGAGHLAAASAHSGVTWIVHVSTQSVKLARQGRYARTKLAAEKVLECCPVPVTTLRPSVVYSDRHEGIIGSIVRFSRLPRVPILGSGHVHFQPIHVDDVAQSILRVVARPHLRGRTLDLGGPTRVSFDELVGRILERLGLSSKGLLHLPPALALLMARVLSVCEKPPITRSNVLGAMEDIAVDVGTTAAELDFLPRTLAQGLDQIFGVLPDSVEREGRLLFDYLDHALSSENAGSETNLAHYRRAVVARADLHEHRVDLGLQDSPFVLGAVDMASRWRWPDCPLQKKLRIAAALYECQPQSAKVLLPRDRSRFALAVYSARLVVESAATGLAALALLLRPGYVRRHAGVR